MFILSPEDTSDDATIINLSVVDLKEKLICHLSWYYEHFKNYLIQILSSVQKVFHAQEMIEKLCAHFGVSTKTLKK